MLIINISTVAAMKMNRDASSYSLFLLLILMCISHHSFVSTNIEEMQTRLIIQLLVMRLSGLFRFRHFGTTPWTGDRPIARPLSTQARATHENAGFEPTIPMFERSKIYAP